MTVSPKMIAALKGIGYSIHYQKNHEKRLPPFDSVYTVGVPEVVDSADFYPTDAKTEEEAWALCLEVSGSNHAEALMGTKVAQLGGACIARGGYKEGVFDRDMDVFHASVSVMSSGPMGQAKTPWDAVHMLWVEVNQ